MPQNVETPAVGAVWGSEARSIAGAIDGLTNSPSSVGLQVPLAPSTFRPIGEVAAEIIARIAWRRKVAELRGRGDRVLAEFLAHFAAERGIPTYVDELLDSYLAIDLAALELAGADRLPPAPLRVVPS